MFHRTIIHRTKAHSFEYHSVYPDAVWWFAMYPRREGL